MLCKHFRYTIVGLLALASATSLFARGQFWVRSYVNKLLRIQITRNGLFHTIQLRVSGEAIFFDRLVVHFNDGASQELIVSDRISPGGRNYVIDLLGERSLQSVELWYYKEPWGHNPTVSVYGIHLPDPDASLESSNSEKYVIFIFKSR